MFRSENRWRKRFGRCMCWLALNKQRTGSSLAKRDVRKGSKKLLRIDVVQVIIAVKKNDPTCCDTD